MSSANIWIAPLIEHCFSTYLQGQNDKIEVEDNGRNLRFFDLPRQTATVNSWIERDTTLPMCNLTDSQTQVDVIFTRESLRIYEKASPHNQFNKDTTRGRHLELLDYEVVFEYSFSQPTVHLDVKQFNIAWDSDLYKGPPRGKSFKKYPPTYKLMQRLFQKVKPQDRKSSDAVSSVSGLQDLPHISQGNEAPHNHDSQGFIATQVQPSFLHPKSPVLTHEPQLGPTNSGELLGYLGTLPKPTGNDLPLDHVSETAKSVDKDAHAKGETGGESHSSDQALEGHSRRLNSADIHESMPATVPGSIIPDKHHRPESPKPQGSTGPASVVNEINEQRPECIETFVQEEQISAGPTENVNQAATVEARARSSTPQKEHSEQPAAVTRQASNVSSSGSSDPWYGMTMIRKRDIKIPKDQSALFEQHTLRWVPPPPGEGMPQGHVPPPLLKQWNDIARQRNHRAKGKDSGNSAPESVGSHAPPVDRFDSPTPPTDSSSEEELQWSESPPQRRPHRELPADSSPPRAITTKEAGFYPAKHHDKQEDQPPKESKDLLMDDDNQRILQSTPQNHTDENLNIETSFDGAHEVKENNTSRPKHDDTRVSTQYDQDESDKESDDSMMDTSVPCPLGQFSQQSHLASQSEQEFTSSGPSLPGSTQQGRVQVLETPAADLNRRHYARLSKSQSELESHRPVQVTPQGKSSSQSRIINTYPSNDAGIENTQDTFDSSQMNDDESSHIDIMGTQLSNGNWEMQDTTPASRSGIVLDSSEPKRRELVPVPNSTIESEESSNPFSSHHEVLSSQSLRNEDAVHATLFLTRATPSERGQTSPLKRFASDLEAEGPSAVKRHKTEQIENGGVQRDIVRGLAPSIISRRQSYISGHADHAEAQEVFAKFRSDYPVYLGDFAHFTKLCSKLQALRATGALKRSFLWDDFIIKHLEEYPTYIQQVLAMESKSQKYEEYFASNFSRPSHKKRSLTVEGIEVAASQYVSASPSILQLGKESSFTGSLAERFSNLHAHSFGPATQDTQSDVEIDRISFTMSSPTPYGHNRRPSTDANRAADTQAPNAEHVHDRAPIPNVTEGEAVHDIMDETRDLEPAQPSQSVPVAYENVVEPITTESESNSDEIVEKQVHPSIEHVQESDSESMDKEMTVAESEITGDEALERDEQANVKPAEAAHSEPMNQTVARPSIIDNDGVMDNEPYKSVSVEPTQMSQHKPVDETVDEPTVADSEASSNEVVDEVQKSASIELGDEALAADLQESAAVEDVQNESESENEGWFDSLRHMRPTEPRWSDDPNTPFKAWVRADQNIMSERRRHDRAPVTVDEKGVIERPIYYKYS